MSGNLTADMEDFRLGTIERLLGGYRVYVTDMDTGCVLGGDAPVSNIWVGSVTIMGGNSSSVYAAGPANLLWLALRATCSALPGTVASKRRQPRESRLIDLNFVRNELRQSRRSLPTRVEAALGGAALSLVRVLVLMQAVPLMTFNVHISQHTIPHFD